MTDLETTNKQAPALPCYIPSFNLLANGTALFSPFPQKEEALEASITDPIYQHKQ